MNKNLAIYVSSCDKYSWLWPGFFYFFRKYWPDCRYNVYLGTETITTQEKGIIALTSGKRGIWGEITPLNLGQIKEDYILWLQEDYFLTRVVKTEEIEKSLEELILSKGKYLRLYIDPDLQKRGIKKEDKGRRVSKISNDYFSTCSLQSAIWERGFLLSIIDKSETPWEFEANSLKKSLPSGAFYSINKSLVNYGFGGAMQRGKLLRKYIKFFLQKDLRFNDENIMSIYEDFRWHILNNPVGPIPGFFRSGLYTFFLRKIKNKENLRAIFKGVLKRFRYFSD